MKAKKMIITTFLILTLSGCVDTINEIDYHPDYFSELYTCPTLDIANSVFILNDGTFKIVSIGAIVEFTYERKEENIYYIFDGGELTQKILIFDDFYVMFQSDVEDSLILQMTEDMFDSNSENLCFKRDY